MQLSIIIPNRNGSGTILNTIKSIYSSVYINKLNFEIIVVDDVSEDDSIRLVKSNFPTVRILHLKQHSGASAARNLGIEASAGNLLLFIDNDAWFNHSAIHTLVKSLTDDIDIAFPKINYENGRVLYPLLKIEKDFLHISGCFLMKKDSLKKMDSAFDEYFGTYLEDYDFFIRCKLRGLKAKYIEEARVIHVNKPAQKDYRERYFLEVKNTLYGMIKLGAHAKKSGMDNPFKVSSLFKEFFCGIFNFAWFNWYSFDRGLSRSEKIKLVLSGKNKIFLKRNVFTAPLLFLKGVLYSFLRINQAKSNKKSFIVK